MGRAIPETLSRRSITYKRTDMTESHRDGLLDLVYGTLPVAEGPRAECDARDSVA